MLALTELPLFCHYRPTNAARLNLKGKHHCTASYFFHFTSTRRSNNSALYECHTAQNGVAIDIQCVSKTVHVPLPLPRGKSPHFQYMHKMQRLSTRLTFEQPTIIIISLVALILSPRNFFDSLAPDSSSGVLFQESLELKTCGPLEAWNTPQLRVLVYQFMGALAFSAIIEPVLLFVARYKLSNAKDAEHVIEAVLICFSAFDVLHSLATITVVGTAAVFPSSTYGWAEVSLYACINVWVPVAWLVARACWFTGLGRCRAVQLKRD